MTGQLTGQLSPTGRRQRSPGRSLALRHSGAPARSPAWLRSMARSRIPASRCTPAPGRSGRQRLIRPHIPTRRQGPGVVPDRTAAPCGPVPTASMTVKTSAVQSPTVPTTRATTRRRGIGNPRSPAMPRQARSVRRPSHPCARSDPRCCLRRTATRSRWLTTRWSSQLPMRSPRMAICQLLAMASRWMAAATAAAAVGHRAGA